MNAPSERALVRAAEILARTAGFKPDSAAQGRLQRCVLEEAQRRGVSAAAYVTSLEEDRILLLDLIDRVTVQESAFFRDPSQFDALANHVLPALPAGSTIWSAGCANGQEPYSVLMLLDEIGNRESRVLATDVSTTALDRTRHGRYTRAEVRGLTRARRDHYLRPVHHGFEVQPDLRARVDVAFHNLATQPPPFPRGTCPLILCRNVIIYFGRAELIALLDRLADWMPPGGWLFLGYSESLWQITERFRLVKLRDAFVYQRVDDGAAPSPERGTATVRRPVRRRAPTPARRRAPRETQHVRAGAADDVEGATLLAQGEAAARSREHETAIAAFRKLAYLFPDEPMAHLRLALALENAGDHDAATRAYRAARGVLHRGDAAEVQSALEGYHAGELARLLDTKLADRR